MNVTAIFLPGQTDITVNGLHQWDYGQKLQINSPDLPPLIEVHFSCVGMTDAIVRNCFVTNGSGSVTIPDVCLEQSAPITAWIFEIDGTTGTTTKTITLPIISRARPTASDEIPEEIADKYTEAVTEINGLIGALAEGDVTVAKAKQADTANSAITATKADTANSALTATKATRANEATNASSVNGVAIKQEAGILKIGDIVIPQRVLKNDTQITVGYESSEIYNSDKNLSGRTFEFVDALGTVYKIIVDSRNTVADQFKWVGAIHDANFDSHVFLEITPEKPKTLSASCEAASQSFVIDKIYEIIE